MKTNSILRLLTIGLVALCACSKKSGFESSGCWSHTELTTGLKTITSDSTQREYYLKLPEGYTAKTAYPLVLAFHGTGGDYTRYTENDYYNIQGAVGDEAILVYPNALPNANNVAQWDYDRDLIFFDDLFQELEANACFDTREVFALGHSSGAGISHTLGCKRGNILRAISPVAGSLVDSQDCIGQVAVIQIHGSTDTMVPPFEAMKSRDYWAGINSCSREASVTTVGIDPSCEAYGECDQDFPVQFCLHDFEDPTHSSPGHAWPDFAGEAIWEFFKGLPPAAPSDKPGTGEVPAIVTGRISFKIHYPSDFEGIPETLAVSLYPHGTRQPLYSSPTFILNTDVPIGDYRLGEISEYSNVETDMTGVEFGDYTLSVVVYIAGGNYPIPTTGKDYTGLQDITIDSTTIIADTPFELEHVQSFRVTAVQ